MKVRILNVAVTTCLLTASAAALAGPQCTEAPNDEWINQADMQERISEMGYEIKEFKVTDGNCYEIYGWDDQERNTVDASIVKQEVED